MFLNCRPVVGLIVGLSLGLVSINAAEFDTVTLFRNGTDGYNVFRIPALIKAANGDLLAFCEARTGGDASQIDLVARRGAVVAFIEVKTRFSDAFGSPLEAVTATKQREISRVAGAWIDRQGKPGDCYRLDVIGVTMRPPGPPRIEHVADAFRPGWR